MHHSANKTVVGIKFASTRDKEKAPVSSLVTTLQAVDTAPSSRACLYTNDGTHQSHSIAGAVRRQ